jgi:putative transposase
LAEPGWGGKRKGAGRKRSPDAGAPHLPRPKVSSRFPLFITVQVTDELSQLRGKRTARVIQDAVDLGKDRFGFRLNRFSAQGNQLQLLAEAPDSDALARGMQGLLIRLARALNRLAARKGRVFTDRYQARVLRTPAELDEVLRGMTAADPASTLVPPRSALLQSLQKR